MSSGLDYVPSSFADTSELVQLCQVLLGLDGVYVSHLRGYGAQLAAGMGEFLEILDHSGVRGHISHLWGKHEDANSLIRMGLERQLDVTFDAYPYEKGSSILAMVALPSQLQVGGVEDTLNSLLRADVKAEVERKVGDISDTITIASTVRPEDSHLVGLTIAEASEMSGQRAGDFVCDLLRRSTMRVSVLMGRKDFDAVDMAFFLDHELHMGSSDGIYYGMLPHPRGWAAFTTSVEHYLKNGDSWASIANHLSTRAAERFGLHDRGQLREGYIADIAVIAPLNIRARATYEDPRRLSEGTRHVLIGGVPVIRDRVFDPVRAGRAIRR